MTFFFSTIFGTETVSTPSAKRAELALVRRILEVDPARGAEGGELALQVILALVLLLILDVHRDGKTTLIELDVDLILVHASKICLDLVAVALILDIHGERARSRRGREIHHVVERVEKRRVEGTKTEHRTIRNHASHNQPLLCGLPGYWLPGLLWTLFLCPHEWLLNNTVEIF